MSDPTVRIDLKADTGQAVRAAKELARAWDGVAKSAADAGRAEAAASLRGIGGAFRGAGFSMSDTEATIAGLRFREMHPRLGTLQGYLGAASPGAQARVIRELAGTMGLTRGAGAFGGGGFGGGFGGGMLSRLGGMAMGGGAFALGVAGFSGIASFLGRGVNMAQTRDLALNDAIRSTGALRSFDALVKATDQLSDQFHFLYTDTAKYTQLYAQLTGNLSGAAAGVGGGLALARAFSIAPGTTMGLMATGQRTMPGFDAKRLAVEFADQLSRSGMPGMGAAFAQAMTAYADRNSALNVGRTDMLAYGGLLSGLMGVGGGSVVPGVGASIIGAADQALRNGGAGGPFGAAWMMSTISRATGLKNPFILQALEQGGLFASPDSMFRKGPLGQLLKDSGVTLGHLGTTTNFDAIMSAFDAQKGQLGAGAPEFLASKLGLNQAQAAALYSAWKSNRGSGDAIMSRLKALGIPLADVNETGLGEMASILGTKSLDWGKLQGYGQEWLSSGKLSADEKKALTAAMGGRGAAGFENLRNVLFGDVARHGQVENAATDMRDMKTSLDNIATVLGTDIKDAVVGLYDALAKPKLFPAIKDAIKGFTLGDIPQDAGAAWVAGSDLQRRLSKVPLGPPSAAVKAAIASLGPDASFADFLAVHESGRANIPSGVAGSSALGIWQATKANWAQFGKGLNPLNEMDQATELSREFAAERAAAEARYHRLPTPDEMARGHHYGIGKMFDTSLVPYTDISPAEANHWHINITVTNPQGKVAMSHSQALPKPGTPYVLAGGSASTGN